MTLNLAKTGLSDTVIEKLNKVFSQFPPIARVILFGSRAKGDYRHGSDIDLVMEVKQLSFEDMINVEQQLDDLLLPYNIDLLEMNSIKSDELLAHIKRIGITLYKS